MAWQLHRNPIHCPSIPNCANKTGSCMECLTFTKLRTLLPELAIKYFYLFRLLLQIFSRRNAIVSISPTSAVTAHPLFPRCPVYVVHSLQSTLLPCQPACNAIHYPPVHLKRNTTHHFHFHSVFAPDLWHT